MDQTPSIPSFFATPPAIQGGARAAALSSAGAGAISGGLLRPGSIDQPQFQAMLQAAQAAQATALQAGTGPQPPPGPASIINSIPNLTPAQFAVLTGGQATPNQQLSTPAPVPTPAMEAAASPILISGVPASTPVSAPVTPTEQGSQQETPEKTAQAPAKDDPRVVHFKRLPDKDERKALTASGKRWVVDETPGSRKLFFGDDEVFGWDDFVDLINPLQHIPVVAQIYRAVTGDQIGGAAEILGAVPFGPSGFISAVADLAVRDVTGKDIGGNVIAMMFSASSATDAVQTAAVDTPTSDLSVDRDNGGHDA